MADLNQAGEGAPPALDPNDPLDRIAMEAMGGEQAAAAAEDEFLNGPPEPEPIIDPAQTWAQIPFMLGKVLSMAMPEMRDVYTEAACLQWGVGMAAVAEKYDWDAGEAIAKWGPEIALCVATVPLAVPTYHAVKARIIARREAEEIERRKADTMAMKDINPAPGPGGMQPGNFSDPH